MSIFSTLGNLGSLGGGGNIMPSSGPNLGSNLGSSLDNPMHHFAYHVNDFLASKAGGAMADKITSGIPGLHGQIRKQVRMHNTVMNHLTSIK